MKTSKSAAILRIFMLLLITCSAAFYWETSRNAEMQPVTGSVQGKIYKGYSIVYQMQGRSYQFETRFGIVDFLGDIGSLSRGNAIPLLADPEQRRTALINTWSGRYGITLTFVAMLCLLMFLLAVLSVRRGAATLSQ